MLYLYYMAELVIPSEPLADEDLELISIARELVTQPQAFPDRHRIGTAMRLENGDVITGVCVQAEFMKITGVCAERIALGQWATAGKTSPVVTVASVRKPRSTEADQGVKVTNSCGGCLDILTDYFPDARMVTLTGTGLRKVRLSDMLPGKYRSVSREA